MRDDFTVVVVLLAVVAVVALVVWVVVLMGGMLYSELKNGAWFVLGVFGEYSPELSGS